MSASKEAVGITRISSDGTTLVVVGIPVPEGISLPIPPDKSRAVVIGAPFRIGGVPFLVAGVHIYGEGPKRAGTDIVIFDMDHVHGIVKDHSGLGKTGEIILGAGRKEDKTCLPQKQDRARFRHSCRKNRLLVI